MRIVTWNCRVGNFRGKAERIAALHPLPDVLVVQEVENRDAVLVYSGHAQPILHHRATSPEFPRRGTGVSYTGASIQSVEEGAPFGFNRYEVRFGELHFNLAAVWAWATKEKGDSYRQAHNGLNDHAEWVRQRPSVMLGDFNMESGVSGKKWKELEELVKSFGFVSAYHSKFREPFGAEKLHTHFHLGRSVYSLEARTPSR